MSAPRLTADWLLAHGYDADVLSALLAKAKGVSVNIPKVQAKTKTKHPVTAAVSLSILPLSDSPGPWRVTIPGWRPISLNRLIVMHWAARNRAKKRAYQVVGQACLAAGVVRATGKRRVSIEVGYPKGVAADEDNVMHLVRNGLVRCGALVDDSHEWVETGSYWPVKGLKSTTIILEETEA